MVAGNSSQLPLTSQDNKSSPISRCRPSLVLSQKRRINAPDGMGLRSFIDRCIKNLGTEKAEDMVTRPSSEKRSSPSPLTSTSGSDGEREFLPADAFKRRFSVERKRTERSGKPFLLMLLETGQPYRDGSNLFGSAISALLATTRETDAVGWYKNQSTLGVIFTELVIYDMSSLLSTMLSRVSNILRDNVTFEQFNQISVSFHFFPDKWDHDITHRPSNPVLYPDLSKEGTVTRLCTITKRTMDVIGSILILILFSPVFLAIALAIAISSRGPVLFRQQRIGQYGKPFTFLKFRSMQANNDPSAHKEYVAQLIAGNAQPFQSNGNGQGAGVYKLTNDARVTRVGAFLRRSSLDELPQVFNVLMGHMSLVGPRPALPYEVAAYKTWHRRRILEVKPGITGLWQVNGRCRLTFDEMVRLDIRYARSWSPWVDMKILLRTPQAVLVGDGAC
jgi:lipopolysaccharide/colanic/teichoic acid biosynthesis glycosyltransferase